MSQPRDTLFNASSPHSSTGNADSYKNEGTPETRLTAFSPEEGSARSSKYYSALTLTASDPQPLRFPGKPLNAFRPSLGQAEKDPFITSQSSGKREQRLSPLASDFQPFSLTVGGRGQPAPLNLPRNDGPLDTNGALYTAHAGNLVNGQGVEFTRYVVLTSAGNHIVNPIDANALLSVSLHVDYRITSCILTASQNLENLCGRFKGKRYIHASGNKVYVRFTNLHDACMVFANVRHGGADWRVDFVPPGFWQVSSVS